jgi:hypothetical protein
MTTAQPPAPLGPRQTPQARRSAPFPTSPVPRVRGTARAAADAPRRSAAADAPRAPPLRTAASTALLITALRRPTPTDADSRRPTPIHAERRRFTPNDADRSPGIAVVAPPHAPPGPRRTPQDRRNRAIPMSGVGSPLNRAPGIAPDAPGAPIRALPDFPPSPRVQGAFRGRARRRRRRRCTRRRQRNSHCTQCIPTAAAPPLRQCAPLRQRPPLRQCRRRPRNRDDGDSGGPQGDNDRSDGAAYGEKRGGRETPPRFSPYLAAKQRRPPDASSASGACKRARARQNVRITERMEQRIGGGSAPDVGDPPVIRRHPAGDPRLSAPNSGNCASASGSVLTARTPARRPCFPTKPGDRPTD